MTRCGWKILPGKIKHHNKTHLVYLVGGWTNPVEKCARQNGFIFPNLGVKMKNIWNHHLDYHDTNRSRLKIYQPTKERIVFQQFWGALSSFPFFCFPRCGFIVSVEKSQSPSLGAGPVHLKVHPDSIRLRPVPRKLIYISPIHGTYPTNTFYRGEEIQLLSTSRTPGMNEDQYFFVKHYTTWKVDG